VNSQIIEYDVGYNQKIRVNTMASEAFTHSLDRDVDDLENALSSLKEISATVSDLDTALDGLTEGTDDYNLVQTQLDAANKAYNYVRENIHNIFQNTITSVQNYMNDTNVAVTDNGTRSSRLELVSNRLMDQKTTFETLQSENEDADIAEVAVQLTSSELTYNAALMATGKIMQTSLMNYI
jgi:flagellar hook-associated protein 3 FlgL